MNTPKPCDVCIHLYWDPMHEEDPTYEAECKKGLQLGNSNCSSFNKTGITFFGDLPDKDHPGKTIKKVNLEKVHSIPLGSLVELKNKVRLFVVFRGRDCDGTPLYWLSDELYNNKWKRIGGYSEKDLKVIKL